ncbi:TolC family protein [Pedobacter sp. GR22-10]|uniref:TolC family protein n=1 Tax=Pedobacter sp. GR22-10 TaxID=2994472 RepID=UPI0022468E8A|nr:TolC family protein [Pedobacter sp. GR22-10]MCX2430851.1 TolC family protein [Pedobacter sp. GR22-10]
MFRKSLSYFAVSFLIFLSLTAKAQKISLKEAVNTALTNYGTIKAKDNYANASKSSIQQAKREYLPNFSLSAQQDYGTINGQNGPQYGLGGLGAASSGPALDHQNWNAAFGALYLANINWDFFTFGRVSARINIAGATYQRDQNDLEQEKFQQEIRVSAAYLNLLAAKRLTRSQEKNLARAIIFKNTAVIRAKNGLIAGVDSSFAKAEVSSARIALTKARDVEQEQANKLGVLMGLSAVSYEVDTASITRIPGNLLSDTSIKSSHPLLRFYQSRIAVSDQQVNYYRKLYYPTFSFFGVTQTRGSGFSSAYLLNQNAYTSSYLDGIKPTRENYLIGIGMTWNLSALLKNHPQVRAQSFISAGLKEEYEMADQQLRAQLLLAEAKLKNALENYREAPIQVKAASDAYLQKSTLYKNGLTTLVDLTQSLFTLNRAETDRDIAYTNVWQALLLKSAALGNYDIFINEF